MNNSPNKKCKIPAEWFASLHAACEAWEYGSRALHAMLNHNIKSWKPFFESMDLHDFMKCLSDQSHQVFETKELDMVLHYLLKSRSSNLFDMEIDYEKQHTTKRIAGPARQ